MLSNHLIGKQHKLRHRLVVGGVIMVLGTTIASTLAGSVFHIAGDVFGYLLHGAGTTPFLEWITGLGEAEKEL